MIEHGPEHPPGRHVRRQVTDLPRVRVAGVREHPEEDGQRGNEERRGEVRQGLRDPHGRHKHEEAEAALGVRGEDGDEGAGPEQREGDHQGLPMDSARAGDQAVLLEGTGRGPLQGSRCGWTAGSLRRPERRGWPKGILGLPGFELGALRSGVMRYDG